MAAASTIGRANQAAPVNRPARAGGAGAGAGGCRMEVFEGNPIGKWVWANIWKLPLFRLGAPGQSPCTFGDSANIFRTNIEQASLEMRYSSSFSSFADL